MKNGFIIVCGGMSAILCLGTLIHALDLVAGKDWPEVAYWFGMFLGAVGMVACWKSICMAHAEAFEKGRV